MSKLRENDSTRPPEPDLYMPAQGCPKKEEPETAKSKGVVEATQGDTLTSFIHILRATDTQACPALSTSQTFPNDADENLENEYHFSSLPGPGSIRLLRLMPHEDGKAPIQCQLFDYRLQESGKETHLYEALSYVWGSDKKPLSISIDKRRLPVTANLHAALTHLRDHFLERIIWVDAICINQKDEIEKGEQVRAMAEIYCKANRVIVWLGEATADDDRTLKAIRIAADDETTKSSNNATSQQAILALLQRPWFQRIWVRAQTLKRSAEVIDKARTGTSGSCCCSTCPDQVWLHGD
jgi:hypothetical protein